MISQKKTELLKRTTAAALTATFVLTGMPGITNAYAGEEPVSDSNYTSQKADVSALLAQLMKDNGDKNNTKTIDDFMLTDEPVEINRGESISIASISSKFTAKNLKKSKASVSLSSFTAGPDAPVTVSGKKITANSPLKTAVKVTYRYHKKKTVIKKIRRKGKIRKVKKVIYSRKKSKKIWLLCVTACPDENPGYTYDGNLRDGVYSQAYYAALAETYFDYDSTDETVDDNSSSVTPDEDSENSSSSSSSVTNSESKADNDNTSLKTRGNNSQKSADKTGKSQSGYTAPTYTELKKQAVDYLGLTRQEQIDLLEEIMTSPDFYSKDKCGNYCKKDSGWNDLYEFSRYYEDYWKKYIYNSLSLTAEQKVKYTLPEIVFSLSYRTFDKGGNAYATYDLSYNRLKDKTFAEAGQEVMKAIADDEYGYNNYNYDKDAEITKARTDGHSDMYIQVLKESMDNHQSLGMSKHGAERAEQNEKDLEKENEKQNQERLKQEEAMKAESERLEPMIKDLRAKQIAAITKNADTEYMKFAYLFHYVYSNHFYIGGPYKQSAANIAFAKKLGLDVKITDTGEVQYYKDGYRYEYVCEDFASALYALCSQAGIECKLVSDADHEWCHVKIDGQWYASDPTWGPGYMLMDRITEETGHLGLNTGKLLDELALNKPDYYHQDDGADFGDMPDYYELMKQYYPEEYARFQQKQKEDDEDTKRRYPNG